MTLSFHTTKKAILGLFVAIFIFSFATPFASAQTYFYTSQNSYSSPQIQSLLNQLQALMDQLQALRRGAGPVVPHIRPLIPGHFLYGTDRIDVSTDDADVESDDTVVLSGELDLDDASYADVWFEYGTDGDMDEDSDSLRLTEDDSFEIEIDDLDEDDRYFFRAVAEGPSGYRAYGAIKAFSTDEDEDDDDDDNDSDDEIPEVTTEDVEDVDENSAELHGEIDMNDFENGVAFFVYGEDEGNVADAADEDTYNDVDEDGDDLQKILLSSNLDDDRTFWSTISGLDDDTEHFFMICVEYEDEDGDDTLECGDVESFTTDED